MGLFQGINVVSISVSDLDAARAFYRDVLELGEPVYDLPEAGWIEFRTGGGESGGGNLAVTRADPGREPSVVRNAAETTLVLKVEDCHSACEALRLRGVRCEDPVVFPGFVVFCDFFDPFGNRLQMCSDAP